MKCCRIGSILGSTVRSTVQAHLLCPTHLSEWRRKPRPRVLWADSSASSPLRKRLSGRWLRTRDGSGMLARDHVHRGAVLGGPDVHRGRERGGARQTGQPDAVLRHAGQRPDVRRRCGSGCDSRRTRRPAFIIVLGPIIAVILAGILFAIFNAALGGEATFKQLFAVSSHAAVISSLGAALHGAAELLPRRGWQRDQPGGAAADDRRRIVSRQAAGHGRPVRHLVAVRAGHRARQCSTAAGRSRSRLALFGVYAVIAVVVAAIMSRMGGA